MSDLCLYVTCLRKVATYLGEGIYKSCHKNPFSFIPSPIVNDLVSTTIDVYRQDGISAGDLELLLTSGRLVELKIHDWDFHGNDACQFVSQVLRFLLLGCHELEVLHLTVCIKNSELPSDVLDAFDVVLRNSPYLEDLVSSYPFDLKTLRKCKKLRSLKLLCRPRQPLYEFLEKENGHFLPHKYLQFLCCHQRCHVDEMEIILCHCPKLTSMGNMDTSEVLSRLQKMHFPSSELKLRQCYWEDERFYVQENRYIEAHNEIRDAVLYYPVIEELDLDVSYIETISYLSNLRHLVYLNIDFRCGGNAFQVFRNALQEIGTRLKHLSFHLYQSFRDISLLMQHCPNLESLEIDNIDESMIASSVVHLPYLKRLYLNYSGDLDLNLGHIILQFSGCNELTDLFLSLAFCVNDEIFSCFLKKNSISNLKVAYMVFFSLTEMSFREFLLNAPELDKVVIKEFYPSEHDHFKIVASDMNHKAIVNQNSDLLQDFFFKRYLELTECCVV